MKLNYTLALLANYVGGFIIEPALNLLPRVLFDSKNYNYIVDFKRGHVVECSSDLKKTDNKRKDFITSESKGNEF